MKIVVVVLLAGLGLLFLAIAAMIAGASLPSPASSSLCGAASFTASWACRTWLPIARKWHRWARLWECNFPLVWRTLVVCSF